MLVSIACPPGVAAVNAARLPHFWATVWSFGAKNNGKAKADSTMRMRLRHIDAFYDFCDERFKPFSLDSAISQKGADAVYSMVEAFYNWLTEPSDYTTTDVQCWDSVRGFVSDLVKKSSPRNSAWRQLGVCLGAMGRISAPGRGEIRFPRALPSRAMRELAEVASPSSPNNPFKREGTRVRNHFIIHLLLECGLRRGEAMLLSTDSLNADVSPETGEIVHWLDVTNVEQDEISRAGNSPGVGSIDPRATKPHFKTPWSHRQIPVSPFFVDLYHRYVSEARVAGDHGFLITSKAGDPLAAESYNKILRQFENELSPDALKMFRRRTHGKKHVSPHDLRHTCATVRFKVCVASVGRELALQKMRAFFGWSKDSEMPDLYARAAIEDDLLSEWHKCFDAHVSSLRRVMI